MKKIIITLSALMLISSNVSADTKYKVIKGDTMWKIASKHKVGTSEIINANPQISNPDMIYPGQLLTIPTLDNTVSQYEAEVVRLVNEARKKEGLSPLTHDWELSRVARYKSQDMKDNNYFSHQSPTYGSPFDMIKAFGISYRSAGENIARGQKTPEAVFTSWMNSSGHRKNILSPNYTKIGIGYVKDGNYWTQMFTGK